MNDLKRKTEKHDRLKAVVKWLVGNGIAKNQEEVGRLLGYSNKSAFSQVLNAKVSIPSGFTYRIAKLDSRLNEHWISEGWGGMTTDNPPLLPGFEAVKEEKHIEPNLIINKITQMREIIDAINEIE